jgi:hypothetical protein
MLRVTDAAIAATSLHVSTQSEASQGVYAGERRLPLRSRHGAKKVGDPIGNQEWWFLKATVPLSGGGGVGMTAHQVQLCLTSQTGQAGVSVNTDCTDITCM